MSENTPQPRTPPRINVLGVGVSSVSLAQAVATINDWVDRSIPNYVCVTGVHGVMESRRDPELRRIHNNAGMAVPDGMPMVWLNHLYGRKDVTRVYGPDLMLAVCEESVGRGYSHFFYGGGDGVADELAAKLSEKIPGLRVAGTYAPPFRPLTPEEDAEVTRRINDAGADIVWVGLSTPKQERWMAAHAGRVGAPVLVGVGAAFDFHTGRLRQAPGWIQHAGMEWLFRLLVEPGRLWRRYFRNNPEFLFLIASQLLQLRRFPIESMER